MPVVNSYCRVPLDEKPEILLVAVGVHHPGRVARYLIRGLWCLHFYRYEGEMRVDGQIFPIKPGCVSLTPPDAVLEYTYGWEPSVHAVTHFALQPKGELVSIPVIQDLGEEFSGLCSAFERAIEWRVTRPQRAAARVWEILWRLHDGAARQDSKADRNEAHPAIAKALRLIEMNLNRPLSVSELAEQVHLSHNHFTRVFQVATGSTPSAYIRRRRAELAAHLLRHSNLPMKAIAAQVGLNDLQAFNKTIRREMGASPRQVRADKA